MNQDNQHEQEFDKKFTQIVEYEKWPREEKQRLSEPAYVWQDSIKNNPKPVRDYVVKLQENVDNHYWTGYENGKRLLMETLDLLSQRIEKEQQSINQVSEDGLTTDMAEPPQYEYFNNGLSKALSILQSIKKEVEQ
jgi:hypothetical protein